MNCTKLQSEREFHDRQAASRAADLAGASLVFGDDEYLDHASWIRPAFARLGEVRARAVLDLGCGHGMAAVVLARRGARVTAIDLSAGYVREAQARGRANGVMVNWLQADAEHLPFADASFDAVWGNAVLHHLDPEIMGRELDRVLRPGGVAVFCEPWGENPLLEWARSRLPYPQKQRTRDEKPLLHVDVEALRRVFPTLTLEGHQLLAMLCRLSGPRRHFPRLARWDGRILRRWPGLTRWCRYVVLTLSKST